MGFEGCIRVMKAGKGVLGFSGNALHAVTFGCREISHKMNHLHMTGIGIPLMGWFLEITTSTRSYIAESNPMNVETLPWITASEALDLITRLRLYDEQQDREIKVYFNSLNNYYEKKVRKHGSLQISSSGIFGLYTANTSMQRIE
ncbi:uncharacterized protein PADG_02176 [Paracoccidioides brasiliensis Pb18]|uniref:Uncharacterized protein n=1 Tax=Paracoccidioides brasiliensis (strain Pb18) TaxID=502780 RepID=C1G210_PARBD|nr:uncharacterized protein PADG_02176 [Paracoccidioides brasiliensis Pb18]EEH46026.2 hypothetical protein PADG_02176 [Paracoccidioides brasiliensis Pb18]